MSKISELNTKSLTEQDKNYLLKLAEQIKDERLLTKQFDSFKSSKNISIRWDTSYKDFGFSFCGVTVTAEEVEHVVKGKLNR